MTKEYYDSLDQRSKKIWHDLVKRQERLNKVPPRPWEYEIRITEREKEIDPENELPF